MYIHVCMCGRDGERRHINAIFSLSFRKYKLATSSPILKSGIGLGTRLNKSHLRFELGMAKVVLQDISMFLARRRTTYKPHNMHIITYYHLHAWQNIMLQYSYTQAYAFDIPLETWLL